MPTAELVASQREVLHDLHATRRRQRIRDFDRFEALYRVYITAILLGVAVWLLSGITGDHRVGASGVARVVRDGPRYLGAFIGACWAIGLRSGSRGGPLAIEAADVRHVLLAPVDRALALRTPALRQLRFGAFAGTVGGAVCGLLAYRRLPGNIAAWLAVGAATGLLLMAGSLGLAMLVSGRRVGPRWGGLIALAVLGWSAADLIAGTATSPATFLAQLAVWPLKVRATALIGVGVAAVAAVAGLTAVGGSSIEAAERRARLVGQIRFAATLQDIRTVIVLRRQLAQEEPRQHPWIRLPRYIQLSSFEEGAPPSYKRRSLPVWRRGWHGILRFPATRWVRLAVLGALAGAAMVGVWRGTTALVLAAGLAMYVAALDATEQLAQDVDHPDRRDEYPVVAGTLHLRHLGPPVVVMAGVAAIGVCVAAAIEGSSSLAWSLGAGLIVPAALGAVGGAAITVLLGPPGFGTVGSVLPPEAAGVRTVLRTILPPVAATIGLTPLIAARQAVLHPTKGMGPLRSELSVIPLVIIALLLIGIWIRYRDNAKAWWRQTMDQGRRDAAQRQARRV